MYQPAHGKFTVADAAAILAELAAAVPASFVTVGSNGPEVSVVPMLFDPTDGPYGTLRFHIALPNPQWKGIDANTQALAIFLGPQAYVSPAWYEEKRRTGRVVPTWNYVTVVARGTLTVHREPAWLVAHVRKLVDAHEAGRPDPWSIDDAPAGYVDGQAKGIVGFEMRITRIDAKRKLSQNRSDADIEGTIGGLSAGTPSEQAVAAEMRRRV